MIKCLAMVVSLMAIWTALGVTITLAAPISENETYYRETMTTSWSQYEAHHSFSASILDEFLKRTISSRDAMAATVSAYTLLSQTMDVVAQMNPPMKHADYHNDTLDAMKYLKKYLIDVTMYFETGNRDYIIQAQADYNKSTQYRNQAMEAAFFLN